METNSDQVSYLVRKADGRESMRYRLVLRLPNGRREVKKCVTTCSRFSHI